MYEYFFWSIDSYYIGKNSMIYFTNIFVISYIKNM